jgi:hypothetical protein
MSGKTGNYLGREESQMYDREPKYPLQATSNAAHIEYTLRGLTHLESRRCTLVRISKSSAMVEFQTELDVADQVFLSIPDARVERIGCVKIAQVQTRLSEAKVTVTLRFLKPLEDRQLSSILANSLTARSAGAPRMPNILMER